MSPATGIEQGNETSVLVQGEMKYSGKYDKKNR